MTKKGGFGGDMWGGGGRHDYPAVGAFTGVVRLYADTCKTWRAPPEREDWMGPFDNQGTFFVVGRLLRICCGMA
jgi:hypothetical protein